MHDVEGHFSHTSIEDILRGKLNLRFIHHDDMPKVIELIIQATNISFEDNGGSISLVDLVIRRDAPVPVNWVPVGLGASRTWHEQCYWLCQRGGVRLKA